MAPTPSHIRERIYEAAAGLNVGGGIGGGAKYRWRVVLVDVSVNGARPQESQLVHREVPRRLMQLDLFRTVPICRISGTKAGISTPKRTKQLQRQARSKVAGQNIGGGWYSWTSWYMARVHERRSLCAERSRVVSCSSSGTCRNIIQNLLKNVQNL